MAARDVFLAEVESLRQAVDLSVLHDSTVPAGARDRLIAGIAITAFVTLEWFVGERAKELSAFVSGGASRLNDLDAAARRVLLERTGRGFSSEVARSEVPEVDRIATAQEVGAALVNIGSGALRVAPVALAWTGSNLQTTDVEEGLQILGCPGKPWEALTELGARSARQKPASSLKVSFETLATTRHRAAHSTGHATSVTVLRSLPRLVLDVGLAWDCLASHLAFEVRSGRLAVIPNPVHRLVKYRYVERIGSASRHIAEGKKRGVRAPDTDASWDAAVRLAGTAVETVVQLNRDGEPVRWLPAFCP